LQGLKGEDEFIEDDFLFFLVHLDPDILDGVTVKGNIFASYFFGDLLVLTGA
jgi:hypothetical protein